MTAILPPDTEAVPYDFRRPPWITRDRRAVLDGVHSRLLPLLAHQLAAQIHRPASVVLREAAQITFGAWRAALPAPCAAFIVPLSPADSGDGLLLVEGALAPRLVDLALGGDGETGDRPAALTLLEQGVLGRLLEPLLTVIRDGYREVTIFTPGPLRFEEIAERITIVDTHERIYLLDLEVRAGEVTGGVTFCLPAALLRGFLQGAAAPAPAVGAASRELTDAHLRAARVPVVVRLPGFQLRAAEGAALAVGQVLETSHPFQGMVELHVQDRRLFLGALGRQHGHVGLRILAPITAPPASPRVMRRTESS